MTTKQKIIRLLEKLYRQEDRWGIEDKYPIYADKIINIVKKEKKGSFSRAPHAKI